MQVRFLNYHTFIHRDLELIHLLLRLMCDRLMCALKLHYNIYNDFLFVMAQLMLTVTIRGTAHDSTLIREIALEFMPNSDS